MLRKSEESKKREHRGKGVGINYKPYIQAREINSTGTCSNVVDWKTGRSMELLSQGELAYFYILRWDDNVMDIREQFPLDIKLTTQIAERNRIRYSTSKNTPMTTDFLVTDICQRNEAYSIKFDKSALDNARTVEKLFIEKKYWEEKDIPFHLMFTKEVNMTLVNNLRLVMEYYDVNNVHDPVSMIKHKIATKQLSVDLENKVLDFTDIDKFKGVDAAR